MRTNRPFTDSPAFFPLLCLLTVLLLLAGCASGPAESTVQQDTAAQAESKAESSGDEATEDAAMEDESTEAEGKEAEATKSEDSGSMESKPAAKEESMPASAPAMTAGDAAAGAATFKLKCSSCHGADGSGNEKMAAMMKVDIRDLGAAEVQAHDDAALTNIITAGQGKMKPIKGLSEADLNNLVAYIRSLKK